MATGTGIYVPPEQLADGVANTGKKVLIDDSTWGVVILDKDTIQNLNEIKSLLTEIRNRLYEMK
jgi:hypothetical protein